MDGGRIDDLLRADVYASGLSRGVHCRDHDVTGPALDGADGAKPELRGGWLPQRLPVSAARSRCKVLRRLHWHPGGGWNQVGEIAAAES